MVETVSQPPGLGSPALATAPKAVLEQGRYELRFARTPEELDAILELRFRVFNLEMGEGLEESFEDKMKVLGRPPPSAGVDRQHVCAATRHAL